MGIFNAAFIGAGEIHASCTAAAMRAFKMLIRILVRDLVTYK